MRGTPTGGGNFYITKKTTQKEREAALEFIKFMTSPEQSANWSIATGYIGISEDAYKTDALQKYVNDFPAAKVAMEQLQYATAEFSTYQTGRIRKLLDDAIQSVLTGSTDAKSALQDAQAKAKTLLKDYN
jgi:sn-glycerol 3-phosphate transport system substrate-binding protein